MVAPTVDDSPQAARLEHLRHCVSYSGTSSRDLRGTEPVECGQQTSARSMAPTAAVLGVRPTSDAGLALRQLAEHGLCILDAVMSPADVATLRMSAERTAVAHDKGTGRPSHDPIGVLHVTGVLNYDQTISRFLAHPRVMAVLQAAFASTDIRVSHTTLQVNTPGCKQQQWHADNGISQPELWEAAPNELVRRPAHINTLWMLSDFTPENGATWVLPASHRQPGSDSPKMPWPANTLLEPHHDAVHVAAPAGCVCLFDCRLHHSLAPNISDQPRTMINVRYAPKYVPLRRVMGIAQGQPPWPNMSPEVFAALPAEVKPLFDHAIRPPPAPSDVDLDKLYFAWKLNSRCTTS
jgi:hypothetical protein